MGNYPDFVPGERVSFNANRENEINHLLNGGGGFGDGRTPGRTTPNVRLQAWNSTNSTLQAGKVVQIAVTGSTMSGEAFPIVAFSDVDAPFGVLTSSLSAGEAGDLLVSGMATVTISGSSGNYAKPVSGGTFVRGNEGVKILHVSGTKAIILLGDYYKPSSAPGPTPTGGVPAGTIIAYAGPLDYDSSDNMFPEGYSGYGDVPAGWLHCHGQAVSRTDYADLFAAIGTVYGAGDGSTTFNVPDFRGSFLRGAGYSAPHDIIGIAVVEDEENPGEYVDAGYVEVKGSEIESGEAVISGQTVNLAGATITPSGVVLNGTTYQYSNLDLDGGVIEVSGAGYVDGFQPIYDESGEGQDYMGQHLSAELPNLTGSFWGITAGKGRDYDSGTPYIPNLGVFVDGGTSGLPGLLPFPLTQDPTRSPYTTGVMLTTYPNGDTFDNIQIFGSTSGYSEPFQTNVSVTRWDFSTYNGQKLAVLHQTAGDYIRKYGYEPPESMLTVRQRYNSQGYSLPQRHLVHWLIKC